MEQFEKAKAEAGEFLVTNWHNEDFAKTPEKPKVHSPPKPTLSSAKALSAPGTPTTQTKGKGDAAMLEELQRLDLERQARRQKQASVREHRNDVLAAHPGGAQNEVTVKSNQKHPPAPPPHFPAALGGFPALSTYRQAWTPPTCSFW
jgi:hypothetical protein